MSNTARLDPVWGWVPAAPEPLWVGWRLNTPSCCGIRFRGKDKMFNYETHWFKTHREENGP